MSNKIITGEKTDRTKTKSFNLKEKIYIQKEIENRMKAFYIKISNP